MLASILIIVFSSVLLVYWFRYTCILLVRNGAEEVRVFSPAAQGSFNFAEIQNRLRIRRRNWIRCTARCSATIRF